MRGFTFGDPPGGGSPASAVSIPYPGGTGSQVSYRYDGGSGRYLRLYSQGNTADDFNHYVEVEVYGIPKAS